MLLSHRNFASLAAKLAGLFDLRRGEGVLSVLPLHHTFEFSCGLLVPLLLGAEITYLDELTTDRLSDALQHGRIQAMIGVPALWQLLHRLSISSCPASSPGRWASWSARAERGRACSRWASPSRWRRAGTCGRWRGRTPSPAP